MVARLRSRTCTWPRFSRYELRGGRIAPAAGAKIRWYGPWRDYLRSRNETRGQPPYMSLLSLVDRLKAESGNTPWVFLQSGAVPGTLSEQNRNAILDWTNEHGPLGLFHQVTTQIEDPMGEWAWTRGAGRWHRSDVFRVQGSPLCLVSSAPLVPDLELRGARDHLAKYLGLELPGEMPAPDSEEFFTMYGEPLWEWGATAIKTAKAIFERDEKALNVLACAAARVRRFEEDRVQTHIVFPSLLSVFAEMAWQDLEGGNWLGKCAHCGEMFIADRKWTTYCSPRCGTKARQRRFLERNPEYYRTESRKGGAK